MSPAVPAAGPDVPAGHSWPVILTRLVGRNDLDAAATQWVMSEILAGAAGTAQIAGFAVALRTKGETAAELAGLADAMLAAATPLQVERDAVDIVGSGGDRAGTVNVSTMAAIVAAAAGARVVKHGNRSASSLCGSADVLEALGVILDLSPDQQARVIETAGIGFLFAVHYHPSFRHTLPARRELGIATPFNFLGPLTNPGRPRAHAVGVADAAMAPLVAGVFADRGDRAVVFHGDDGLDELTTTATSTVYLVGDGVVTHTTLDPAELGIPAASVDDLHGGDPAFNSAVVRRVAAGEPGPVSDVVALNAAAGLLAYGGIARDVALAEQLAGPLATARAAIADGAMAAKLAEWVAATQREAGARPAD